MLGQIKMGLSALTGMAVSVAMLAVSAQSPVPSDPTENTLAVDLSKDWTPRTEGAWRIRYDHRGLLAMRHPWTESRKGGFASVSREITVPSTWKPPISLWFYCSDDYVAEGWTPDGSWLTAEGFVGHRLKQILVDDHVVWMADVADVPAKGTPDPIRVELPATPGKSFVLTLLVYDVVESTTVLPTDFYQSSKNEKKREEDPTASRFQTHVYWGDVCLAGGDTAPKRGARPTERLVRSVHTRRWPLPPFGDPFPDKSATIGSQSTSTPASPASIPLSVSIPAGVPKEGFPARCGIPFHSGRLTAPESIRLRNKDGTWIVSQKSVLSTWPDDSIQWLLFDFVAMPDHTDMEMVFAEDTAKRKYPLQIETDDQSTRVDTGGISFRATAGTGLAEVSAAMKPALSSIDLTAKIDNEDYEATTDAVEIEEQGPFRGTLLLKGRFSLLDRSPASYTLRVTAYSGLPYLSLWLRVFSDTHEKLAVSGLKLRFTLANAPTAWHGPSGDLADGSTIVQPTEKSRTINGTESDPLVPMFVAWAGSPPGAISVRHFRERAPRAVNVQSREILLDLIAAEGKPIVFTPGEATSHEVWLALGDVEPAALAGAVTNPPVMHNAAYFCSTGVLGPAAPHQGVAVLDEHMRTAFGQKRWEDFGQQFGVRDFPDSAYFGGPGEWCNNYYERMLGLWSEWFMTGDRAWYDRAFDVCRHIMDVAVIHSPAPGNDWVGAIHGPGKDHVAGPWNPTLRTTGLSLYHKLTGDRDALEDVLGVGEFCVRTRAGMDSPSVRDHAGPFDATITALLDSSDVKYLDDGTARIESVMKVMDMRRGTWPEVHGSAVYRGNVPWMAAQLARPLYWWYRTTGDVQAAQAVVGLAESIICENTNWDEPGVVSGYSHNPHYAVTANYDLLILPVIFAAYELTEDPFFLDAAKAQWARWMKEKQFDSPLNCYWNTPWLVWYLKHHRLAEG